MRTLLKRPNLLVYPSGAPGIDFSHPASRNLLFSGVPQGVNFINLLSALKGTIVGVPTSSIDGELGPLFNTPASADIANYTFPTTAFSQGTMAGIFVMKTNTGGTNPQTLCGDSSGGSVGMGLSATDGSATQDFRWGGVQFLLSGGPGPINNNFLGVPWFYAVTIQGGASAYWVIKRLDTGQVWFGTNGSMAATSTGTGTFSVGNRSASTNRQLNGGVAACMRSVTTLTQQQLRQWADDPWSFWYPRFDFLQTVTANIVPAPPVTATGGGKWIKGVQNLREKRISQSADVRKAAAVLSKMGGLARAKALTSNQRSNIASKAAQVRWNPSKP